MPFYNSISNQNDFLISFSRNPILDFGIFAKGYFSAASQLAEDLLSKSHFSDYEAYPIVFLYRHSLELYLKNVIYKAAFILAFYEKDDFGSRLFNDHRLDTLSEKAVEILQAALPTSEGLTNHLKNVVRVSREFSSIDRDSYAYRYPISKKGDPSTSPHQRVNLETLHHTMSELLDGLDTVDFGLNIETEGAQRVYEILKSTLTENRAT